MQNSYSKIINLQFNEGYKFIELERESNPNNGLIVYNLKGNISSYELVQNSYSRYKLNVERKIR